jgi:polar amino acid transport system substrate-binding protein
MKKRYIIILSCLFLLGMLTGCIQKDQLADGTKLIDKQKFIFAASGEFKPFSYVSNDDLSMTGFDIEVGNAVGRELGLEPVQKRMKLKDSLRA